MMEILLTVFSGCAFALSLTSVLLWWSAMDDIEERDRDLSDLHFRMMMAERVIKLIERKVMNHD